MTTLQTFEILSFQPSTLSFFFVFFPLFMLAFHLIPVLFRPILLLVGSLGAYYLAQPESFWMLISCVVISYAAIWFMQRDQAHPYRRLAYCIGAILYNLMLNIVCHLYVPLTNTPFVFGFSIYTLCAISALCEIYHQETPHPNTPLSFALFICFFPRLFAGPIQPYSDFAEQLKQLHFQPSLALQGWGQYIQGMFQSGILGSRLLALYYTAVSLQTPSVLSAWLSIFSAALGVYFMLAGFSDMAQGIARILGVSLPQNFYYPYQSRSLQDFYHRFYRTVSRWFQDNIYRGLCGNSPSRLVDGASILITTILMALWMDLRLNNLLWGIYLGGFILLERYAYPKLVQNMPTIFCRMVTFFIVLMSFTLFAPDTPAQSIRLIGTMVDFRVPYTSSTIYLLASNWLLLVLGALLSTNLLQLTFSKLRRKLPLLSGMILGICNTAILIIYVAFQI